MTVGVAKSAHAARYYTEPQAGTFRSEWVGKGAVELGLSGAVEPPDFKLLLDGYQPNGDKLVQNLRSDRIAGYDCTFGAPKSVSIGILVEGDTKLLEAHREAISYTYAALEAGAQSRTYRNKKSQFANTRWTIGANFQHTLSRDLDPHIHNHIVILNATKNKDEDRFQALYTRRMIFERIKYLGKLYRDKLAEGVKSLGHKLQVSGNDMWELEQYPADVLKEFSRRRQNIVNAVGLNASRDRNQWASLLLRKKKNELPLETLHPLWMNKYKNILKYSEREKGSDHSL